MLKIKLLSTKTLCTWVAKLDGLKKINISQNVPERQQLKIAKSAKSLHPSVH